MEQALYFHTIQEEAISHLVPHNGLLHSGKGLKRGEEAVDMLLASHQGSEGAQLLSQGQQYLKHDHIEPNSIAETSGTSSSS